MRISDWSSDVCSSDLLGLIVGNLIGGIAAAVAYNLALAGHSFLFFVTVLLAASLAFAGRIVTAGDRAPVYAIALATFVLLLGLGLSPLPGGKIGRASCRERVCQYV